EPTFFPFKSNAMVPEFTSHSSRPEDTVAVIHLQDRLPSAPARSRGTGRGGAGRTDSGSAADGVDSREEGRSSRGALPGSQEDPGREEGEPRGPGDEPTVPRQPPIGRELPHFGRGKELSGLQSELFRVRTG